MKNFDEVHSSKKTKGFDDYVFRGSRIWYLFRIGVGNQRHAGINDHPSWRD